MKLLNKSTALSMIAAAVIAAGSVVGMAQTTTAPATTAPATRAAPTAEIARINGKGIPREDFTNALIQIGGLRLLDEFWAFAVTMEACETAGIVIGKKEIDAAKDLILKKVVGDDDKLKKLTDSERDSVIVQVLARQGVASALQADWTIKTLAGLQAMAIRNPDQIKPTDEEMKNAKAIAFAKKATVRDFVSKTSDDAMKVRGQLAAGKKIAELTDFQSRELVLSQGDPNLPTRFKDAVFGANMKEGLYTQPLVEETPKDAPANAPLPMWHVLVIETIEEAKKIPEGAELEKFNAAVADQKLAMWRQAHLNKLKSISKVEIVDPILKDQAVAIEKAKADAAKAATMPGAVPVPTTLPK